MFDQARILAWLVWDSAGFFEWLSQRPWYAQILTDWAATLPVTAGDRGLDVGCGPGQLAAHLHELGIAVTGLDRSAKMVARARRSVPECTFVQGDALAMPLQANTMDLAIAASVVNVIPAARTVVAEMARVVRPGGHVSVLFPTPRLADDVGAITRRSSLTGLSAAALGFWAARSPKREPAAIATLLHQAGLVDVRIDAFFHDTVASVTGAVPQALPAV